MIITGVDWDKKSGLEFLAQIGPEQKFKVQYKNSKSASETGPLWASAHLNSAHYSRRMVHT